MTTLQKILLGIAGGAILIGAGATWFLLPASPSATEAPRSSFFGTGDTRTTQTAPPVEPSPTSPAAGAQSASQRIFKIADGPVAGATFIQTLRPTTTLVRFIKGDNGHVQDLMLDSPGAIPRAVSNTTIPGIKNALWAESGNAAIVQYLDSSTVKTAYLGFPATTTATSSSLARATRLQFLPDGIAGIAVSPDGRRVAYLLSTAAGVDGYISSSNGVGSSKVFSLPLSQITLLWPAPTTLLAYTKPATGVLGTAFSINSQNGNVVPLLFAPGLSAVANQTFSRILYQATGETRYSYVRDVEKGTDLPLSLDPSPEKCVWSGNTVIFCAAALEYVPPNYLDLWHKGAVTSADVILLFHITTGRNDIFAVPGGRDGGVSASIAQIGVSSDSRYLLFITGTDRSLWGVRLAQ